MKTASYSPTTSAPSSETAPATEGNDPKEVGRFSPGPSHSPRRGQRGLGMMHLLVQSGELHAREGKATAGVSSAIALFSPSCPDRFPSRQPQLGGTAAEDAHAGLGLLSPSVVQGWLLVESWEHPARAGRGKAELLGWGRTTAQHGWARRGVSVARRR